MTRVKICGITNLDDALASCTAGADAIGFIFAESPRQVQPTMVPSIVRSLPSFVVTIGVFVNEDIDTVKSIVKRCSLDIVQLHGNEDNRYIRKLDLPCIKAFRVMNGSVLADIKDFGCDVFLLDTYNPNSSGGTGKTFNWKYAAQARELGRVILAGGLTPENVTEALSAVHPYAVDVSSGVESAPGKKDHEKVKQFINEVRAWDYRTNAGISASSADDLFLKR